ncbi:hypothetical protein [Mariniphaga sediminis]|nr:hypothetical protein [Mariniphaga sediminis]
MIEKKNIINNINSVELCVFSVTSVVKEKDSTTKHHKEGTESRKEINNKNSVELCVFSVFSVVKEKDSTAELHKLEIGKVLIS